MPSIDEIEMTSPSQGSTTVSPPLSIQKTPKEMIRSSGNSPREPVKYTGALSSNHHVMSFMEYNSSTEMIERKAGGGETGFGLGINKLSDSRDNLSKS